MSLIILIAVCVLVWWIYNNSNTILGSSRRTNYSNETKSINPTIASFIQRYQAGERNFGCIDLSGQELSNLDLSEINLEYANLSNTKLQRVRFINSNLQSVDLSHATVIDSYFTGADLRNANLSESEFINNVTFGSANLEGANLYKAKMVKAILYNARLCDTDMQEADLSSAYMEGALMNSAILVRANLVNANLKNADLTDADLCWAKISAADFSGACLIGADLGRAYNGIQGVHTANFSDADIEGAIMPCKTQAEYLDKYCEHLLEYGAEEYHIEQCKEFFQNLPPEKREEWLFKLKVAMTQAKTEIAANQKILDHLNKSRHNKD